MTVDTGYLKEYIGMAKLTTDVLTYVKTVNATSPEDCKHLCYSYERYHCEFDSSSSTCTTSERDMTVFPIEFNLTYVGIETISYVKSQDNPIVITTVAVPNVTYNHTDLPCYTDPVQTTASTVATTEIAISPPAATSTIATTTAVAVSTAVKTTTSAVSTTTTTTTTTTVTPAADVSATTTADFPSSVTVSNTLYLSPEQVQQLVVEIKQENTVDVKTLSSYRNKFISVRDNRPSSKTIGYVGVICISLLVGLLVVSDVPKFINDSKSLHNIQAINNVKYKKKFFFKKSKLKNRLMLNLRRNSI
ncbi:bypass of stop codon protein 1-like [Pecten maximus]|uniref:bypass of stop codon protein 1-like n=1 Tax=Pecten maximus TaxID=6579 RepID=UPI0014588288|nr:bypass of stop codon protein 1-like [Pecten maximus]